MGEITCFFPLEINQTDRLEMERTGFWDLGYVDIWEI